MTGDMSQLHLELTSAIRCGEQDKMIDLLQQTTEINQVVNLLSKNYVPAFLDALVMRLEENPLEAPILLDWIKSVLSNHCAYIMTVPDIVQRLSSFYKYLEKRVTNHQELLKLQGRLDLVLNQEDPEILAQPLKTIELEE